MCLGDAAAIDVSPGRPLSPVTRSVLDDRGHIIELSPRFPMRDDLALPACPHLVQVAVTIEVTEDCYLRVLVPAGLPGDQR